MRPTSPSRTTPSVQGLLVGSWNRDLHTDPTDRGTRLPDAEAPYCIYGTPRVAPDVWKRRVPDAVVRMLLDAGPTLVVGDAPGDPDCFCSAIALARGRQALGLPAVAHVDAPPPKQVQGLLRPGELATADDIRPQRFDTVVFVDNDGTRVGPEARRALANARRVVVIDHHEVDPTHASLGLAPDTQLVVWKDTEADAAALMVLAAFARTVEVTGKTLLPHAWQSVLEPLVGAIYSDTRGFEADRARPATVGLLGSLLATGSVDLARTLGGFGGGIARSIAKLLAESVTEREVTIGAQHFGAFSLSSEVLLDAWTAARELTPELTWSDVLFAALDHVEVRIRDAGYDVAIFAVGARDGAEAELPPELIAQLPPKAVKFSVRTLDGDLAPLLAQHLGGGGKPHEGGGVTDEDPTALFASAEKYLANRAKLAERANLLNLGN